MAKRKSIEKTIKINVDTPHHKKSKEITEENYTDFYYEREMPTTFEKLD